MTHYLWVIYEDIDDSLRSGTVLLVVRLDILAVVTVMIGVNIRTSAKNTRSERKSALNTQWEGCGKLYRPAYLSGRALEGSSHQTVILRHRSESRYVKAKICNRKFRRLESSEGSRKSVTIFRYIFKAQQNSWDGAGMWRSLAILSLLPQCVKEKQNHV